MAGNNQNDKDNVDVLENTPQDDNQDDVDDFEVPTTYDVRPGTIDYGKEYEIKLATLFSLLSAHSDKDMWIGVNVNDCGDFDDIVLYRKTGAGKHVTIMIQVKHEEKGKDLTQQQFSAEKGNFSLQKYSVGLSAIKEAIDGKTKTSPIINHLKKDHEKIFIIFTNKGVPEYKFLPKVEEESVLNIFNVNGNISKLNYYHLPFEIQMKENSEEYMNNLFFFTKQSNIKELDKPITDAIKKLIEPLKLSGKNMISLVNKFTRFVDDWSKGHLGGHYPLTKAHILKVLASLLLETYEAELEEPKEEGTFNTTSWSEMINTKTVTIIDADDTSTLFVNQYIYNTVSENLKKSEMQTLWARNRRLINRTMLKVVPSYKEINLYDAHEYLWKSKEVPLVLKVGDAQDLENLQHILKISAGAFRVIILSNIDSQLLLLNFHNSFRNLQDLNKEHQQEILRRSIKLQGRRCDELKTVVIEELFHLVTVKDVIHILLDKFNIGKDAEPLPEFFVERSIPKVCIRGEALEEVKTDIFVIKCASPLKFTKFLKQYKLRIPNSNIFQKYGKAINADIFNQFRIIISDQDVNLENMKIDKVENRALHCLVLHDSSYLEWKKSFGSISAIRPFRLVDGALTTNNKKIYNICNDETYSSYTASSDSGSEDSDTDSEDSDIRFIKKVQSINTNIGISSQIHTFRTASVSNNLESHRIKELIALFSKTCNTIPIVISADPGMGKSVLMDYIALNISSHVCVIRINLIQHIKYYNREDFEKLKPDDHLHNFGKSMATGNKLDYDVFKKYIEKKNIMLLFDGFDEIPIAFQCNVIKSIISLYDLGYFVCVTTRPVAKIQLEESFNTFAVDLVPFSETDQNTFLFNYFDTRMSSKKENRAELTKLFVTKLLNATKKNFNAFDKEFMGVPLQTKLLAEVFVDHCEKFQSSHSFDNENFDMLYLFKNFIAKKEKIICDKFGDFSKEECVGYRNYTSLLALQLLFEETDLAKLNINKQLQDTSKIIPNILEKVQKGGIVVAESESNIWFAHRTFAEYLCAQWLSENINGEYKIFVKELVPKLFQPNYNVVRNLYDRILAQGCAVHLDVINGCIHKVKQNISSNPHIMNETDKCGRTPLHVMAARGVRHPHSMKDSIDVLQFLLISDPTENCLKILSIKLNNIRDSLGYTPLDYALFSGSYNIANVICKHLENFSDNICNSNTDFELIYVYLIHHDFKYRSLKNILLKSFVATNINTAIAELRLINDHYYDEQQVVRNMQDLPNLPTLLMNINDIDGDSYTLLHVAVMLEKKELLNFLLSQGSTVNIQDITGKTALHWASAKGDVHSVNILLENDSNVNLTDNIGMTPLHYTFLVTKHNQKDIVAMLLEKEAAINIKDNYGNTALQYCVYYSHMDTFKTVINHITRQSNPTSTSSNIDYFFNFHELLLNRNSQGETIVHWAAENNLIYILSLFKDFPELSTIQDDAGCTPLHFAAMGGHTEFAKLLLSHERALHPEEDGTPRLQVAGRDADYSSLSISRRAELEIVTEEGETALHIATAGGHLEFVTWLLSKGANVEAENNENCTALHIASCMGHLDIATLLLLNGADVNAGHIDGSPPLLCAIPFGYLDIVSLLSLRGADINAKDDENSSMLYIAAYMGHLDIVSLLLSKGADVNAKDDENCSALHIAVGIGHLDIVSLLLSNGADINAKNDENRSALHIAVKRGHIDVVSLLLSKEAEINAKDDETCSALHIAVGRGHLDIVSLLLSNGADINPKNDENRSALHIAVKRGHIDVVSLLLSKEADINAKDDENSSALHIAVTKRYLDIVSLLLSKGADINAKDDENRSALHIAVERGHLDIVSLLLLKEADINAKDDENHSALHIAVESGHIDIVSLLLSKEADINAKDDENSSPLHIAVTKGYYDIVSLLLLKGADVDAKNYKNWSALHIAAESGRIDIVSLVLSKGANVNVKDNLNCSVLHTAAEMGHGDIVSLLLSKGANVNAKNDGDCSALHIAAKKGHRDVVLLLLSAEADVDARNNEKNSALHIATKEGHFEVVELLLSAEAHVDARNNKQLSALHIAATNGHSDIALLLLIAKANADAKNNENATPLHFAAENGHLNVIRLLLSKGANAEAKNINNVTPLHAAALKGQTKSIQMLISSGAMVNVQDNTNCTALHAAAMYDGCTDGLGLILSSGANKEAKDDAGRTALHIAAVLGHSDAISLLLHSGAHMEAKTSEGCTPLHKAATATNSDGLYELLNRGADIEAKDSHGRSPLHIASLHCIYNSISLLLRNGAKINKKDNTGRTALYYAAVQGDVDIVSLLLSEGADVEQNNEDDYTELHNAVCGR